jgi:hypothetical protein
MVGRFVCVPFSVLEAVALGGGVETAGVFSGFALVGFGALGLVFGEVENRLGAGW